MRKHAKKLTYFVFASYILEICYFQITEWNILCSLKTKNQKQQQTLLQ